MKWATGYAGHRQKMSCRSKHFRNPNHSYNTVFYGVLLPCGHTCGRKCCECRPRQGAQIIKEQHEECKKPCGRDFTNCKHSCSALCHGSEACPLCDQTCDVQCSHARCTKKCSEPCAPCAEEGCSSCCPHARCNMPCAAPCDWILCSQRCTKLLDCNHQCPSVCGAECPSQRYCQICAADHVKDLRADVIMLTSCAEIDLSETSCIFLPCGHISTVESLDGIMAMSDHYELDATTGMPLCSQKHSKAYS